ncbi:pilus assembly PilX family protein [Gynuella sunshinyii]|uniref:Tfp pilus assembly protein PilX n=1 Tax=Gynuella sunshinyii YC6258 TaxID=1445510 RepID=A0A0C5VG69_9GAMM|nr:PilX N-terminal domain-containing pilus assembly protein [Gynuella sunshinyii]AJQ92408.1 tfp pilus assembly protein PilX [Gynuella sunshinyii YC6258]
MPYRDKPVADHRQQGVALLVGLVMLLLLTIIVLAAVRGTDLQERMAGNMRDRNLAFQAAEAALRIGEESLQKDVLPSFTGSTVGYWPDLNDDGNKNTLTVGNWPFMSGASGPYRLRPVLWTDDQWASNSVQLTADTITGVSEQPRFTIEKIIVSALEASQGGGIDIESTEKYADYEYYRITARGVGISGQSTAVVQSTYIP